MNDKFVPKINCRFKIRQDQMVFSVSFSKGVLTFNEVGHLLSMMTGEKLARNCAAVQETFITVADPKSEVIGTLSNRGSRIFLTHNG